LTHEGDSEAASEHGSFDPCEQPLRGAAGTGSGSESPEIQGDTVSTGGTMAVKSVPDVKFCLVFHCEPVSLPVMRRVLGDTLRGLGVDEESVYDLLLAATEACTNVLTHGGRQVQGYAVVTSLGPVGCQVEVADEGAGLASRGVAEAEADPQQVPVAQLPESGRGLAVMRACVDNVTLDSRPGHGTVVILRKHVRWSTDAPLQQYQAAS
jgi:serine/threonine-protein kinase RsbW